VVELEIFEALRQNARVVKGIDEDFGFARETRGQRREKDIGATTEPLKVV
jgi:hypothetical protein